MRDVAQLVAHYVRDVGVAGSNPVIPTEYNASRSESTSTRIAFIVPYTKV